MNVLTRAGTFTRSRPAAGRGPYGGGNRRSHTVKRPLTNSWQILLRGFVAALVPAACLAPWFACGRVINHRLHRVDVLPWRSV